MNKAMIMGRLTRDPDVRYTQGQDSYCIARYTIAVDRPGKANDGQRQADFISCVAYRKTAEFVEKYLKKGTKVIAVGRITTGSFTNRDGQKVYTTDLTVDEHYFCESRGTGSPASDAQAAAPGDGFMDIPDGVDDEGLPFNM